MKLFQPVLISPDSRKNNDIFLRPVNFPWLSLPCYHTTRPKKNHSWGLWGPSGSVSFILCQSRPGDPCLMFKYTVYIHIISIPLCLYYCMFFLFFKLPVLMLEKKKSAFSVVSSQHEHCCWLQKTCHAHDIESPSSLPVGLRVPEATVFFLPVSTVFIPLPFPVSWGLAHGTKMGLERCIFYDLIFWGDLSHQECTCSWVAVIDLNS